MTSIQGARVVAAAACIAATAMTDRAEARPSAVSCNPCSVAQTLSFHGTSYRVRKVRLASRIGNSFLGARASGIFVIVTLTMTGLESRPSTILSSAVLIRARGATFDQSDKAFPVYPNGFTILEDLHPHLPTTVVAVYDIPRSYVHGARLRIEDSQLLIKGLSSRSYGYIRLRI